MTPPEIYIQAVSGWTVPEDYIDLQGSLFDVGVSGVSAVFDEDVMIGRSPNTTVYFELCALSGTSPVSSLILDFGDGFADNEVYTDWWPRTNTVSAEYTNPPETVLTAIHTYVMPGFYNVSLTAIPVSGDIAILNNYNYVYVNEISATPSFSISGAITGDSPLTVSFNPSASDCGSFPVCKIVWDFGDGNTETISRLASAGYDSVTGTIPFPSDPYDPRNVIVSHTYNRKNTSDTGIYNVNMDIYACNTSTYTSTTGEIGLVGLESRTLSATKDFHLLANNIVDNGENILFVMENDSTKSSHSILLSSSDLSGTSLTLPISTSTWLPLEPVYSSDSNITLSSELIEYSDGYSFHNSPFFTNIEDVKTGNSSLFNLTTAVSLSSVLSDTKQYESLDFPIFTLLYTSEGVPVSADGGGATLFRFTKNANGSYRIAAGSKYLTSDRLPPYNVTFQYELEDDVNELQNFTITTINGKVFISTRYKSIWYPEYLYYYPYDGIIETSEDFTDFIATVPESNTVMNPVCGLPYDFNFYPNPEITNLVIAYPNTIRSLSSVTQESNDFLFEIKDTFIDDPNSTLITINDLTYRVYQEVPALPRTIDDMFRIVLRRSDGIPVQSEYTTRFLYYDQTERIFKSIGMVPDDDYLTEYDYTFTASADLGPFNVGFNGVNKWVLYYNDISANDFNKTLDIKYIIDDVKNNYLLDVPHKTALSGGKIPINMLALKNQMSPMYEYEINPNSQL